MDEKILDIYAEPGTKVKFLNKNGYEIERSNAAQHLNTDDIYTVSNIDIGNFNSLVELEEFKGKYFNTVMFMEIEK